MAYGCYVQHGTRVRSDPCRIRRVSMTPHNAPDDRRAQHIAALGFLLQTVAFATLGGIALWMESSAAGAVTRFVLVGLPVWVILWLVFKQIHRVRIEQLETNEIRRARAAGASVAIFDMDDEALLIEQNRLRWIVRWLLPATTVVVALLLLGGQFVGWDWTLDDVFKPALEGGPSPTKNPIMIMWVVVGVGFVCFLYARYTIALARLSDWRLLHAGAVFMYGNAYACLLLAISLMATTIDWSEPLLALIVRWAMIVLGAELAVNFILEFYRPRAPGVVARPSFDSRLLSLLSEPGGIAKSIAETVNYQFGFEVSSTWFYQLLQRWLFPITVVAALIVVAMTSVVIVDADEQAVVERFGRPVGSDDESVLGPGLHIKWPYPIDVVQRAPVRRISEAVIGEASEDEDDKPNQAVLWTEPHEYVPEMMLLVAAPKSAAESAYEASTGAPTEGTRSVAVSLLMISVPIEYRIKDVRRYLYNYIEPEKLIENVAYQFLSDYAAGVDIDEFIGPGREAINAELKEAIQQRVDDLKLGVEIVFVGVRGAHPPSKNGVAVAFQSAVSAETNMAATINTANGEARRILTKVAGTEGQARNFDEAIRVRNRLRAQTPVDPDALAGAERRVDLLLMGDADEGTEALSGEVAAMMADARAIASDQISQASAKVRAFATEVAAYEAAPTLYKQRKSFEVYEDIDDVRKYVIVGDTSNVILEYIGVEQGGLDRVLSENTQKKDTGH